MRREKKISCPFFPFRKQNRAGCAAFPGERLTLPLTPLSFLSCPPLAHSPWSGERRLMEGCFHESGGFVLSVVQRSHATVDVPKQPPLLCSASSTIPGTSSSMPVFIESACRSYAITGWPVLWFMQGEGLAPVLYSLPTDMAQKQVIQVCDVRKSLRIETVLSYKLSSAWR